MSMANINMKQKEVGRKLLTAASETELLIHLLVRARSTPCRKAVLLTI